MKINAGREVLARKRLFYLVAILMAAASYGFAQDAIKGDATAPYPVIENGTKLTFSQIDKQYLGQRCTVYFKEGRPTIRVGSGTDPVGMVIQRGNVLMLNGDLYGLSKHMLAIEWLEPINGGKEGVAARRWTMLDDDIDYVMVEKK